MTLDTEGIIGKSIFLVQLIQSYPTPPQLGEGIGNTQIQDDPFWYHPGRIIQT